MIDTIEVKYNCYIQHLAVKRFYKCVYIWSAPIEAAYIIIYDHTRSSNVSQSTVALIHWPQLYRWIVKLQDRFPVLIHSIAFHSIYTLWIIVVMWPDQGFPNFSLVQTFWNFYWFQLIPCCYFKLCTIIFILWTILASLFSFFFQSSANSKGSPCTILAITELDAVRSYSDRSEAVTFMSMINIDQRVCAVIARPVGSSPQHALVSCE